MAVDYRSYGLRSIRIWTALPYFLPSNAFKTVMPVLLIAVVSAPASIKGYGTLVATCAQKGRVAVSVADVDLRAGLEQQVYDVRLNGPEKRRLPLLVRDVGVGSRRNEQACDLRQVGARCIRTVLPRGPAANTGTRREGMSKAGRARQQQLHDRGRDADQERGPQGNLKTMSYGSAYRASYYWAMIAGDPRWAALAASLHDGQQIEKAERKNDRRMR